MGKFPDINFVYFGGLLCLDFRELGGVGGGGGRRRGGGEDFTFVIVLKKNNVPTVSQFHILSFLTPCRCTLLLKDKIKLLCF